MSMKKMIYAEELLKQGYTISELSRVMDVSIQSVRNYINRGELKVSISDSGKKYIRLDDFNEFLKSKGVVVTDRVTRENKKEVKEGSERYAIYTRIDADGCTSADIMIHQYNRIIHELELEASHCILYEDVADAEDMRSRTNLWCLVEAVMNGAYEYVFVYNRNAIGSEDMFNYLEVLFATKGVRLLDFNDPISHQ